MVLGILAQDSSSGSSLVGLALPVLMIVGFYFLLIRPQRNRQRAAQALVASLEVGDDVMTTGGIFGTIVNSLMPTRTLSGGTWIGYAPTRSGFHVSGRIASS